MADIEENARRKAAGKRDIPLSPIAIEVVRRIDALFEIERSINGKSAQERLEVRRTLSRSLFEDLQLYMREQLARLSRGHDLAKAFNYVLKRWASFTLFLEDGRVCLSNNAAERGLRGIALGRKSWLFCGSDRGGQRAAVMYSLIVTAKMNGVDPQLWLADVLARIAAHPAHRWMSCCPGTGPRRTRRSLLKPRDDARQQGSSRHHRQPRRRRPREDEDWLRDVANEMEIEDGVIWVYGVGEEGVLAFTDFGIENLIELVRSYKKNPGWLKR